MTKLQKPLQIPLSWGFILRSIVVSVILCFLDMTTEQPVIYDVFCCNEGFKIVQVQRKGLIPYIWCKSCFPLLISYHWIFIPSKKTAKLEVLWCFLGIHKEANGMKYVRTDQLLFKQCSVKCIATAITRWVSSSKNLFSVSTVQ